MVETRQAVLQMLQEGKTGAEIARALTISKPAVSKHVAKLVEAGLWVKSAKNEAKSAPSFPPPPQKPKTNRRPPPPGPHSTGFKPGNPGGPGAPRRNKNAVTHGEHETIWDDVLAPEERRLFLTMDTGKLAQIDHEIRLITIRERRMLQRIEDLRQEADTEGMTVVEISKEEGFGAQGPIDKTTRKREGALGQIQAIEEALTRVQDKKARLLELKHKVESGDGTPTKPDVGSYVAALNATAGDVWAGENPEADEGEGGDAE